MKVGRGRCSTLALASCDMSLFDLLVKLRVESKGNRDGSRCLINNSHPKVPPKLSNELVF